jgi:hypothetical protein
VASNKDPAIIIWRALNVLAQAQLGPFSHKRILEAEMILLNVMLELWESAGRSDSAGCIDRARRRTLH